ncbi:hypothetical protein ABE402_13710 [Bacillus smithii]|uniref:hypothetical protein n=1 Tax=Bacillus smithii TaxID=1479 RepID=UPI003D21B159
MNWEREALEKIILLLIEKDKEYWELASALSKLGIELNFAGTSYDVLQEITEWKQLPEHMEAMEEGDMSKEEFVSACLEHIKKNFS